MNYKFNFFAIIPVLLLIMLFGCGVNQQSTNQQKETISNKVTDTKKTKTQSKESQKSNPTSSKQNSEIIGKSDTCNVPPKSLGWQGKTYQIKSENTTLEPGMKFGYIKCAKGNYYVAKDDGPGTITVYSNGDPRTNNDLILIGKWGKVLYSETSSK